MCNRPPMSDAERLIGGPVASLIGMSPFGIAPELQERLAGEVLEGKPVDLEWNQGVGDHVKFWFGEQKISASYASALGLWAVACSAVFLTDEVKVAQAAIWLRYGEDAPPDARIELDPSPGTPIGQALGMIEIVRKLMRQPATPWPEEMPVPSVGVTPGTVEGRAMNLFLAALGWVFLHEIGHHTCGHVKKVAVDSKWDDRQSENFKELEFEADRWATRWALEIAPTPEQLEFRILAVMVALVWLGVSNSVRRTSPTHPSAWERLERLMGVFKAGKDSQALWLSGCMMKAFFSPFEEAPVCEDARDILENELIRALRAAR